MVCWDLVAKCVVASAHAGHPAARALLPRGSPRKSKPGLRAAVRGGVWATCTPRVWNRAVAAAVTCFQQHYPLMAATSPASSSGGGAPHVSTGAGDSGVAVKGAAEAASVGAAETEGGGAGAGCGAGCGAGARSLHGKCGGATCEATQTQLQFLRWLYGMCRVHCQVAMSGTGSPPSWPQQRWARTAMLSRVS